MATRKYVVEFINHPFQPTWTIACVDTYSDLRKVLTAEFAIISPELRNELADLLEYPEMDMTAHYRISVTHGRRAQVFRDQ